MRLIVFFDLPTETKEDKKIYRDFRKNLLTNGFDMLQYSIYVRMCKTSNVANKFINRIKLTAPLYGNIRILTVTEAQYENMILLVGKNYKFEEIKTDQLFLDL